MRNEEKLDILIEKIKEKGIAQAKKEAGEILGRANEQKNAILDRAKKEAGEILGRAKKEAERTRFNAKEELKKAKRDVVIALRNRIEKMLASILEEKVKQVIDEDVLKDIVVAVIKDWISRGQEGDMVLGGESAGKIREYVLSQFKNMDSAGIEVNISEDIKEGIRIKPKGEDFYYEISQNVISDFLFSNISGSLKKILSA